MFCYFYKYKTTIIFTFYSHNHRTCGIAYKREKNKFDIKFS